MDSPSVNLVKLQAGPWNIQQLLAHPSGISSVRAQDVPDIQIRDGRLNFKFGDTKSIFYLMKTDLDITPPGSLGGGWSVSCEAEAARTDQPAVGLGAFAVGGKWYFGPERVDLELSIDRA